MEFQLPAEAGAPAAQDAATLVVDERRGQGVTDARDVLDALDAVRDPELDEPVTSLGFVTSCTVSADGVADVRLRLPTYFCAPNFAWLMVADAYDAVSAVQGVRQTQIELEDHFASAEINRGVAARAGFVQSFDGLAETELDELRTDFVAQGRAGRHRPGVPAAARGGTDSGRARRAHARRRSPVTGSRTPPRAPSRAGPAGGRRRAAAGGSAPRRGGWRRRRCPCTYGAPG